VSGVVESITQLPKKSGVELIKDNRALWSVSFEFVLVFEQLNMVKSKKSEAKTRMISL
jgi:hypothetical protein